MDELIDHVKSYVQKYMERFDPSHDHRHVERVCRLAKIIESREHSSEPTVLYRSDIIALASLLHDIGDKKYISEGEDGETMVERLLLSFNADSALAVEVQAIVNHVSYSSEIRDPAKVQRCLAQHPELAVVQDADRLDALGALGIARCFAYNAVKGNDLEIAVAHFAEKLDKLEGMMKTPSGRQMARVRSQRLREFRSWWEEEAAFGDWSL